MMKHKNQNGLSLIELMIAMLIGVLLLLGATGLFMSNKRIYREQDSMGRLQENARFATELLIRDIRTAGYVGCAAQVAFVTNNMTGMTNDDQLLSLINPIEGSENGAVFEPSDSALPTNPAPLAGTDAITVRFMETTGVTITSAMATVASNPIVSDTTNISANDIVAISDCEATDLFQVTQVTGGANPALAHATGGAFNPGNSTADLSKRYNDDASILRFNSYRYYIGNNADGVPSLYRQRLGQDLDDSDGDSDFTEVIEHSQELIEGVENMQLLYGEDTGTDRVADTYVDATAVTNWDNVVSVRIALLFRTVNQNFSIDPDTQTYNLLGTTYDPVDDFHRRKVVNSTIVLRNRLNTST